MRVGIDTFTLRELGLDPYQTLDFIKKRGFDGAQFGGIRGMSPQLDVGALIDIHQYAKSQNMYALVSVTYVNPVISELNRDDFRHNLEEEIRTAAKAGWHELHSAINTSSERYEHAIPWDEHIQQCIHVIRSLRPVLEQCGSRINLETHGETTFDVLRVIEAVGEDIVGVCLDTSNTLVNAEDPVLAAKRVAPYTHMTHAKDGIIYFSQNGITRQGKPPGQGVVDWERILPILGQYSPNLPLSIEDHKWLFEAKIFDQEWMSHNPDLTAYELGQFIKLASETEAKLAMGQIPNPDEYEAIPYLEQMEERLNSGLGYFRELLARLHLAM
jgi:sugar phosphate isomerase/epimerase